MHFLNGNKTGLILRNASQWFSGNGLISGRSIFRRNAASIVGFVSCTTIFCSTCARPSSVVPVIEVSACGLISQVLRYNQDLNVFLSKNHQLGMKHPYSGHGAVGNGCVPGYGGIGICNDRTNPTTFVVHAQPHSTKTYINEQKTPMMRATIPNCDPCRR